MKRQRWSTDEKEAIAVVLDAALDYLAYQWISEIAARRLGLDVQNGNPQAREVGPRLGRERKLLLSAAGVSIGLPTVIVATDSIPKSYDPAMAAMTAIGLASLGPRYHRLRRVVGLMTARVNDKLEAVHSQRSSWPTTLRGLSTEAIDDKTLKSIHRWTHGQDVSRSLLDILERHYQRDSRFSAVVDSATPRTQMNLGSVAFAVVQQALAAGVQPRGADALSLG